MATKWGIVSAGKISNDFVAALKSLPSTDHEAVAIAASNLEKASEFAKRHRIPTSYGSYEELAKDKNVDVVYIGAINTLHYNLTLMMLNNGKHVLCEKPFCLEPKEAETLFELAKKKKLFLMEAVWSRYFPAYKNLKTMLNEIGEILYLDANFGLYLSEKPRIKEKELGGGTVFDIGIYCLQFAQYVMGNNFTEINAKGNLTPAGVDENSIVVIKYPNGAYANLVTHSRVKMENNATIYGTNGHIKILEPFWCPTSIILVKKGSEEQRFDFPLPTSKETFFMCNSVGLSYEAEEVRQCLKKGLIESQIMSHRDSVQLARMEDKILRDIGVKS